MVSKVDQLSTVEVSKKKSQLLQLPGSQFFVDFAMDFSSDFSGKMEEFVQYCLKIFKNFRRSQQSTTWPIRDPATVYFFRESFEKKSATVIVQKSTVDFKAWSTPNCPHGTVHTELSTPRGGSRGQAANVSAAKIAHRILLDYRRHQSNRHGDSAQVQHQRRYGPRFYSFDYRC
jgi:hypothetical protein